MVFRGAVEDYENSGITPSVFMDSSGNLQIYLCDSVIDDFEENTNLAIGDYENNGGQFIETIDVNYQTPK